MNGEERWRLNVNGEDEARWRQQEWRRWESVSRRRWLQAAAVKKKQMSEWRPAVKKSEDGISKGPK